MKRPNSAAPTTSPMPTPSEVTFAQLEPGELDLEPRDAVA